MIQVLFYGNCQVEAVEQILRLDTKLYSIRNVSCWLTKLTKDEFTEEVAKADIIVTQPIADGYREREYLSTSYILQHRKAEAKVFLFDSCHFVFYYFDARYRQWNGAQMNKPISYHYDKMVDCYTKQRSIDDYLENHVFNPALKSSAQLEKLAVDSLGRLKKKHTDNLEKYDVSGVFILSTHDFTRDNYKEKLLFYSMNHPSRHLLQFICEEFLRFTGLSNTMDYSADPLATIKCILYSCVQKNVNFSIADHKPLLLDKTTVRDITQLYYDTYERIGFS
jgi:hypothetical protein